MLNSIYGIFGNKASLKIVYFKESIKITKNYNYSIFAELEFNKVFIKYSSRINESIG